MTSHNRTVSTLAGAAIGTAVLLVTPLAQAEPEAEVDAGATAPRLAPGLRLALSVEPGLAIALTNPQSQRTDAGFGQTLNLLFGVTPYLALGPTAAFTTLPSAPSMSTPGTAWAFGGGARLMRPHDAIGFHGASPWVDEQIGVTFSRVMEPATLNAATFTVRRGATAIAGVIAYSERTATFTPSSALDLSLEYTGTITTGATDPSGNALATDHVWRFTTGACSQASVALRSAGNLAVLAGSTVTSTCATSVTGDLGVSPGTAVTGFPRARSWRIKRSPSVPEISARASSVLWWGWFVRVVAVSCQRAPRLVGAASLAGLLRDREAVGMARSGQSWEARPLARIAVARADGGTCDARGASWPASELDGDQARVSDSSLACSPSSADRGRA